MAQMTSHGLKLRKDKVEIAAYTMKKIIYLAFLIPIFTLVSQPSVAQPKNHAQNIVASHSQNIPGDRWLEMDLYWFNKNDLKGSAEKFWKRFYPLFEHVKGWRGVTLNVGWLTGYILDWRGDLDDTIPIPKGLKHRKRVHERGNYYHGTLAEKYVEWHRRFYKPAGSRATYRQKWTYRDLKKLCAIMRKIARDKYGFNNVKVGTVVLAWKRVYSSKPSNWSLHHPEAFRSFGGRGAIFNGKRTRITFDAEAKLKADAIHYGAYPHGIPQGLPLWKFFGRQWGSMSKKVGLDAIVLRDGMLGPGVYRRIGPFGKTLSPDTAKNKRMMRAQANLVRVTKQSNPKALVIGYSSAASAVGDWRTNAFDLEHIAKQGYLDAFIDQTWAGAWNEIGVRGWTFWNLPSLGWTPQMAFMLIHGAVLAGTRVKHYQLSGPFDAWETWNTIDTAPQRFKWAIWAYSHAAVKTPNGPKMPDGAYIAMGNRNQQRLLSKKNVRFISNNLDNAYRDAASVKKVYGPTLVYNRSALKWQNKHAPSKNMKAWIDEYSASLMKWGVPIMSATKLKWLPEIKTDLPVLETPIHIKPKQKKYIIDQIDKGKPFMIIGSPANGIAPAIARQGGLLSEDKNKKLRHYGVIPSKNKYSSGLDTLFDLRQEFTQNKPVGNVNILYSALDTLPVNNKTVLRLVVNDVGKKSRYNNGMRYDYVDWGDAKLISKSGKVTYLSSLKPFAARQDFIRLRNNTNVLGEPIKIGGKSYREGIGMHAEGQATYRLKQGKYKKFEAIVGLDGKEGRNGQAVAKVYINEKLVFDSGPLNKNKPSQKVATDIPKKATTVSATKSPVLVVTKGKKNVLTWDPPEYSYYSVPMINNLGGSAVPYVITTRAMSSLLKGTSSPFIKNIAPHKTMWLGAWQLKDGSRRILTADLEEGITFGVHRKTTNNIMIPKSWGADFKINGLWHAGKPAVKDNRLKVSLDYKQAKLFKITK